jgi:hypothetical protein
LEVCLLDARCRRLAPKVVVSKNKFVRVVILPLVKKIALLERRKLVERDLTCCGKVPLQAPQRRRSLSLVGGELRKQILVSLWIASLSCFLAYLICFHFDLLRYAICVCRDDYPTCDHLARSLTKFGLCWKSRGV